MIAQGRRLPWSRDQAIADFVRSEVSGRALGSADRETYFSMRSSSVATSTIRHAADIGSPVSRPFLREIAATTGPLQGGAIDAYAWAPSVRSRLIAITPNMELLLRLVGAAMEEFVDRFAAFMATERADQPPRQLVGAAEAFRVMDECARKFASDTDPLPTMVKLRTLIEEIAAEPADVESVVRRFRIEFESEDLIQTRYGASAVAFVVLHECAHHLLNHTRRRNKAAVAPGDDLLRDRFAAAGQQTPWVEPNRRHLKEIEADALALVLMIGNDGNELTRHNRSLLAVGGAFTTILGLDLASSAPTASRSIQAEGVETHPPFELRAQRLLESVTLLAVDHPAGGAYHPAVNRFISLHPSGLALQLWAGARVLREAVLPLLWTPSMYRSGVRDFLVRAPRIWLPPRLDG